MRRLLVSHDRELAQVDAQGVLEHGLDHALEHVANVLFLHEGGFNIDLREFRLAVGAQIFVAEALGDLVVAVEASHHQELLEQLGRLGQREEVAIVHAAGHQVIARAFGRGLGQHRGFDVDKPIGVQEFTYLHRHAVAQHQVVLHVGTAQVQHAVGQAGGFRQVFFVDLERGRDRGVEHRQLMAQHLDLAAFQLVVGRAIGAGAHDAFDLNAKFIAHVFGHLEHLGPIGVADHLHIAFAVAQVNEDDATVVTPTVDPTCQCHLLTQQGFSHQTTIMRTHRHTNHQSHLRRSALKKKNLENLPALTAPQATHGSNWAGWVSPPPWRQCISGPHRHSCPTRCTRHDAASRNTRPWGWAWWEHTR